MKLSELLKGIETKISFDCEVNNVVVDSRLVQKGDLFVCLSGENFDGHNYIEEAKKRGASAIVGERGEVIKVKNSRKALAKIAANYFSNPRKHFRLIGITGTNGKTTTSFIVKNILECAGKKVGLIGTLGSFIGERHIESNLTTPDPMELQKLFSIMAKEEVDFVVMEVSAHALALHKLWNITFDVGILTNVTQDHLDFFKTMENYKKTKLSFIEEYVKIGIVSSDDLVGQEVILRAQNEKNFTKIYSFGLANPADNFATKIHYSNLGTSYFLNIGDNLFCVNTMLCGEFNVMNALAASCACFYLGIDINAIKDGLNTMKPVLGRFNTINLSNGASVVIDYAHTPDGLKKILENVRLICKGRVFCLFGCGGNRDKTKRPIMGGIASNLADCVVLTSDNPRFENPEEIIQDIRLGIKKDNYVCITDRILAIKYSMEQLEKNDVLVLAGKGAEDYIEQNGKKTSYNEYETVENLSKNLKEEAEL